MMFYLLVASAVFAYIIYTACDIKYCLKIPAIAGWFYVASNVAMNYEEDCNNGEKTDRRPIAYVLLLCGLVGAFVGLYIDISTAI